MIIIYNDEKEIVEMFDSAKELKDFLKKEVISINNSMREDGCPESELINLDSFHDQMKWLSGMDYKVEIK